MFDSPITTNDQSLDRVLTAGLPVALVLLEGATPDELKHSMDRLARENAGRLLVVKLQSKENPASVRRYQVSRTPAVVTIRNNQVESKAEGISGKDLEAHIAFLLGKGPRPSAQKTTPQEMPQPSERPPSSARSPLTVSDATFDQQVLHSTLPVLVDFWAPWCGPCRMTDPIISKLASEMAGRLVVAKVNVDDNPQSAMRYDIRSIPTMMLVKGGQVVDRWTGALPEPALRSRVARLGGEGGYHDRSQSH
jgi:thioredoxin 1